MSWRCSNQALSLTFLLSFISLFSMEKQSPLPQERLFGSTFKAMSEVYEDAPQRAKRIVTHLKDPEACDSPEWRYALLYGEPGCGKSTLSKAIGVEADWLVKFIPCGELQSEGENQRNQTGINLYNCLKDIIRFQVRTLVVLDEVNELMEGSDDSHKDTGFTSRTFWNFLDSQAGNDKFFLIGTMNRGYTLPKPMKSRAKGCSIEIEAPKDPQKKLRMFENIVGTARTVFDEECDEEFLLDFIEGTSDFNGRDYGSLAVEARGQFVDEFGKQNKIRLAKRHLLSALEVIRKTERDFKYDKDEISEEKRRHKQNMKLQKKHHQESLELQKKHFVQSQKAQVEMAHSSNSVNLGLGSYTSQGPTAASKKKILGSFTEEQQIISDELDQESARVNAEKERRYREEHPSLLTQAFDTVEEFSRSTIRLALRQFQLEPEAPLLEASSSQAEQPSFPAEEE